MKCYLTASEYYTIDYLSVHYQSAYEISEHVCFDNHNVPYVEISGSFAKDVKRAMEDDGDFYNYLPYIDSRSDLNIQLKNKWEKYHD